MVNLIGSFVHSFDKQKTALFLAERKEAKLVPQPNDEWVELKYGQHIIKVIIMNNMFAVFNVDGEHNQQAEDMELMFDYIQSTFSDDTNLRIMAAQGSVCKSLINPDLFFCNEKLNTHLELVGGSTGLSSWFEPEDSGRDYLRF